MEVEVQCPYCGEPTVVVADEVGGSFVEDCTVCCRPMDVWCGHDDDGELQVQVSRADA